MSSPKEEATKERSPKAPSDGSVMVGVSFDGGIILAVNSVNNLIYYLDDQIYCCANSAGYDREMLIDASSKLENSRASNSRILVSQVVELISRLYEKADPTELLVAGEDVTGLYLVTVTGPQTVTLVDFAALGDGAAGPTGPAEYLKSHWQPAMSLKQAEALARQTVTLGGAQRLCADVCIVFKRPPPPLRMERLTSLRYHNQKKS
ncbi:uncharacterized protein LOC26527643 [Drosophila mojavensis]|uniref:Uncharacterized protein, isoform A n=1 Tax=Drosophila mojavensis TaxID=7230 RepID=A0A0Q9X9Z7_DROMO|nr:uncharacterized protein LOC26527643 [Drosophila mojavensis]KRG05279.1 uncharacterized protein Dmoj_GI26002, isoform A [Drosophila mojavensis]KRG05280.1 uncharacterized protein Dmoj_GI26002, isoform B [Drosophila mojavensis]